jgi:hypothetical protein
VYDLPKCSMIHIGKFERGGSGSCCNSSCSEAGQIVLEILSQKCKHRAVRSGSSGRVMGLSNSTCTSE